MQNIPTIDDLKECINILRVARKESSEAMRKASYSKKVQDIFDFYDAQEVQP